MKQLPNKVWGNFSAGLIGRLITQSISFILVVYLARILGPASYGDLSLAIAVVSYFNLLATFGLPVVGTREAARGQNSADSISQIYCLRICLAVLAYFLLFLYGYFFVSDSRLFYLLLLYGLAMLGTAWLPDWAFIGLEDLRSVAVANVAGSICSCLFILLSVKNAADIFYIPAAMFAGAVLSGLILFYLFRQVHALQLRVTANNWGTLLKVSLPFAVTGGLSQIYENFDLLMLGFMAGPQEVGYYSVAYKIVVVLSGVVGIYSQSTLPAMVRLREHSPRHMGSFFKQNIHTTLFFMLPVVVGGTLLSREIIATFFGAAYSEAAVPFMLLLYYAFLMSLSIAMANLLVAVNEDKKYMATLVFGAVINVIANLVLIPLWQSAGAAAAMIVSESCVIGFLVWKVKALHPGAWVEKRFLFFSAVSCAVMGFGLFTLQKLFPLHVGILIVAGAAIYLCLSWPFCARFVRRTITE